VSHRCGDIAAAYFTGGVTMAIFRDLTDITATPPIASAPAGTPPAAEEVAPAPPGAPPTAPPTPQAPKAAPVVDSATKSDKPAVVASPVSLLVGFVLIALGAVAGAVAHDRTTLAFTPPEGVGIFALFYILAQTIERLQEPLAPFLGRAKDENDPKKGTINQPRAKAKLESAITEFAEAKKAAQPARPQAQDSPGDQAGMNDDATSDPVAAAGVKAANAQRTVDQIRVNLSVIMFGLASAAAMMAAGYLGAFLLRTVGVSGAADWLDILITGLAIGAGTKPLHDLISNIKEAKEKKQDPPETS